MNNIDCCHHEQVCRQGQWIVGYPGCPWQWHCHSSTGNQFIFLYNIQTYTQPPPPSLSQSPLTSTQHNCLPIKHRKNRKVNKYSYVFLRFKVLSEFTDPYLSFLRQCIKYSIICCSFTQRQTTRDKRKLKI